jgi:hypothetical protein
MKDLEWAEFYAKNIICNRWPEAEKYIMKDPIWSYCYARDIIKGQWVEAEKIIKSNEESWSRYQEFLEKADNEVRGEK